MITNLFLVQIIQITFNLVIMAISFLLYSKTLSFRDFFKRSKTLCFVLTLLIMLITSLLVKRSSSQASFQFMLTLAFPLILFFKDSLISRISAYFMVIILETFSESIVLSIYSFANIFFPETDFSPQAMAINGYVLPTLLCHLLLITFFTAFCSFLIHMIDRYFEHLNIQTLLLLSLPFFFIIFGYNIIYAFSMNYIIESTLLLWGIFALILSFLLRGLRNLEIQNLSQLELEKRKEWLTEQAKHYETYYQETLKQRRWAHDLSNHLNTLNKMIEDDHISDAKDYLSTILHHTNETFKEVSDHEI